jgi:hypothetical protein
MRWLKVLAIAVAVVIVFFVISSLVHILYLIGVGLLIAAALFAAFKGWEQYKRARERHEERRQQREERRARPSIEAPRQQPTCLPIDAPRQQPTGLPPAATPPASTWTRSLPASSVSCLTLSGTALRSSASPCSAQRLSCVAVRNPPLAGDVACGGTGRAVGVAAARRADSDLVRVAAQLTATPVQPHPADRRAGS